MKRKDKLFMWYQIREMSNKGLNKSQISNALKIDRATVRKYMSMDELDFMSWLERNKSMPHKLGDYSGIVRDLLELHPYLSAAQVEDRLKEQFSDLPKVHSKTVYNFVQKVRQDYGIKKPKREQSRDFEKLPQTAYGKCAQVDFGEYWMGRQNQSRQKVYFLVIVLNRSRQKYVYFQDHPFSSAEAIYAHQLAFGYYEGVPEQILYDQDKVFIVDENLGDVVLTSEFQRYVQQENFAAIFCRKSDPQTKGKVESGVKYVKNNFLRGRYYTTIEQLNELGLKWLARTANAKVHGTTRKVPQAEWEIEKQYLLPIKLTQSIETNKCRFDAYKVRKDNTIAYRGNFYTVPTGCYKNRDSRVLIECDDDKLIIRNMQNSQTIAIHPLCHLKGKTVRNNNHLRDRSASVKSKEKEVLQKLQNDPQCTQYLNQLHRDKPRYYRDHLQVLSKLLAHVNREYVQAAIHQCMSLEVYNANEVKQIAEYENKQNHLLPTSDYVTIKGSANPHSVFANHRTDPQDLQPMTSDINIYQNLM